MLYIYNSLTNFSFKKHILSTYIHGNEKKHTTCCLAQVDRYHEIYPRPKGTSNRKPGKYQVNN